MRAIKGLAVLVLIAGACGGNADPLPSAPADASSQSSRESAPASSAFSIADALQSDGPLLGVALTGHVDRADPKVRPTLAFTTQDTEVTAMIGLGDDVDEGSTVVVTWYRVEGLGQRERLFSHEIAVGPGGRAFSQAVAPDGLAPGIYDTAATLGGDVVHTPWVVREAAGSAATSDGADGDVPGSGDSYYDGVGPPPAPGPPLDTCTVHSLDGGMAAAGQVSASAFWLGPCTSGTLTATVSGPPTTLDSSDDPEDDPLFGNIDVCRLSGGSDLPGTVVHFAATGSASASEDFTLPDYGESLKAALVGAPEAGSTVEPGDRIHIYAFALVMEPALGVKTLYVDAGTDLLEAVGNVSGSDQPVACDPRRFVAELNTAYEVPSDPPPVIEVCATGVGFDGTASKDCIPYYTSVVWEGTVKSEITTAPGTGPCGNPASVEGTVRLVIAADGSVTGTYDVSGCGVSEPHAEFSGTATDAGFLFPQLVVFTNGSLLPKVSPTHAEGTFTNVQGSVEAGATWVTTWDLTCKTCP